MIKNIQRLKQFGIFQNHTNANAKDFGKYNLFYGWNGSGKSILSGVFRCIGNRTPSDKFPSSEFTVNIGGGTAITQANVSKSTLKVYTFNHDFIDENISWDSVVKSILLVDKEKIEERKKLEELEKLQETNSDAHSKEDEEIKKIEGDISKFETECARRIKASLQSIDTTDNYYLNYKKPRFKSFIDKNSEATKSDESLLDDQKIGELTGAAKPEQKPPITFNQQPFNKETFIKEKKRLDKLLETSVTSQIIQRLVEYSDIKSWVETGLDLHKLHGAIECEFCGNTITKERIKQIEAHFNDDYKSFQDQLVEADGSITAKLIKLPTLPEKSSFYDEFKEEYGVAQIALGKAIMALNEEITAWHSVLREKIRNPLETGLTISAITKSSIKAFDDAITAINTAVGKHNHKSENFQEETQKAKRQLELHYATAEVKSFGYHEKKKEVEERTTENGTLKTVIDNRETEIHTLEDSLSNEGVGASQFNESLRKFIGRDELTLRFNPGKKGYEILRNGSDLVDGNLSEGEKTAIAFVYFITKLKENDNNIEDTIVVVDDPISSFDSNHLLHAFSFMEINCKKAKQLFVLTHNLAFFKLVRDWLLRENLYNKGIANFYVVRANNEKPRSSTFTDAKETLTLYNSEYHYIFSRLHSLKEKQTLETDDHFLAANLSRRLLEAFLSFKFPRKRKSFAKLFNVAVSASKNPKDESKEKIRKFINQYSHSDFTGTNEDFVENQMGESVAVISDIFNWIKELDEKHYQEMIEVVSCQGTHST